MIRLSEKPTVFFDVDATLVFSWSELNDQQKSQMMEVVLGGLSFYVHDAHIQLMKEFDARGHNVVVWSAGGADWAAEVVNALNLEPYVDVVMSKPDWYVDDLSCEEFMPKRIYIELK